MDRRVGLVERPFDDVVRAIPGIRRVEGTVDGNRLATDIRELRNWLPGRDRELVGTGATEGSTDVIVAWRKEQVGGGGGLAGGTHHGDEFGGGQDRPRIVLLDCVDFDKADLAGNRGQGE